MFLLRFFEQLIEPTALSPEAPPPRTLRAFYWHFARQAKALFGALFIVGSLVAVLDLAVPIFIGRVVNLLSTSTPSDFLSLHWLELVGMALVQLVVRPLVMFSQSLITNQAMAAGFTNLVRWQSHWHVARQSWGFFQNDFAGRIANRIIQTGPSLRESVVSGINAIWYILVYGGSAIGVLARTDARLAIPILMWFATYLFMLYHFIPRIRERSRKLSEVHSKLTGRVVDSYTNILTVKLFAWPTAEDAFVRDAMNEHTATFRHQVRLMTCFSLALTTMNAALMVATGATALYLWIGGHVPVGALAMALALTWQIVNMAGWVAFNITNIFEHVGTVQDGMKSIAGPRQMPDAPTAGTLQVTRGSVCFETAHFGYGTGRGVLHGIDLTIAPGERIGLVGSSGAGKSTMVNLLLRFFELDAGRISIDGQDISEVTQESLRANIAMVTQDTSLLHRSIRDNIGYGKRDASEAEIMNAAQQAHAAEFIETLEDWQGRRGLDAQVGERGVKLSGGQRQRIALARVILKNAPILVLDEATSALDSEVEAAIQQELGTLMEGRTVIAIAHRLSTIARMDRLVVLDQGRIVETGSHDELLARGGVYSRLWQRQSGAFNSLATGNNSSEAILEPL
jgi:ATP-binding cassette subfamily B multidrug efflux pump